MKALGFLGRRPVRRSGRGFTVIEVIFAITILAMAAAVLSSSYVSIATAHERMALRGDHEQDLRFVRALLLAQSDREEAEKGGEVDLPGNRRARWKARIEPAGVADLFEVEFTCEIESERTKKPARFEQRLTLLRPTWSDPIERDKLREAVRKRLAGRETPR